eukprot:gnl/MRDRNA2_/MRDRNA2_52109_c0_seq1.p1 gnl/MRDRNA2_/MRDRNA2_52109_c0~~gnl/MRDRNA2_/MRDRNA2_52109_c0_seq1.p1  ORF type:complete len:138 (+),score=13.94 gnl/MRDRNA2_/MRDRNA2_52109_c0_seq1:2-415(+)
MRCVAPSFIPDPMYVVPPNGILTQVASDTRPAKGENLDSARRNQKGSVDDPQVLCIAEGLQILSIGSLDHGTGRCKPCGFMNRSTNRCQSGAACLFCHMCPPRERQTRKANFKKWNKLVAHQENAKLRNRHAENSSQ